MTEVRAVAAAVIDREGRFLVGRRPPGKRHGGLWEFPGGKLLAGESIASAIAREIQEELGMELDEVGPVLFIAHDPDSLYEIHFVRVSALGMPCALEHAELAWSRPTELIRLPMAPADERFVRERLKRSGSGDSSPENTT